MMISAFGRATASTGEKVHPDVAAQPRRQGRKPPRRIGRVLAVVALGWAALASLAILSALPASAVTLGAAQVVPGTLQLQSVSCPSATTCQAVGYNVVNDSSYQGVVVPISNGTPGTAQVASGTALLQSVSCPSDTTCQAVGYDSSFSQGVVVNRPGFRGHS